MKRPATDLRAHLYEGLDQVARTGEPVEVVRGGVELAIVRRKAAPRRKKVPRTIPGLIIGDPDDLIHVETSRRDIRGERQQQQTNDWN